jgi:hypothetical protein
MFRRFVGCAEDGAALCMLDSKSNGICNVSIGVGNLSIQLSDSSGVASLY